MADERAHWESTYSEKTPEKVSWFEPRPQRSLELIQAANVGHEASILDVGGGASSLAAHLLNGPHGRGHLGSRACPCPNGAWERRCASLLGRGGHPRP